MKPGNLPMDLYRGDTAEWQFKLYDDEDKTQPTDLAGVEVEAQIRDRPQGKKITNLTCTVTAPNIIDMVLSAEASKALPITKGAWDLQLTYPDAKVHTIVAGTVVVTPDVTDSDVVTTP